MKIYLPEKHKCEATLFKNDILGSHYRMSEAQLAANEAVSYHFGDSPKTVLDLGCGRPTFHKAWADRGYVIKGIDLSEENIGWNNKNLGNEKITYEVRDIENIKEKNVYDVITWIDYSYINGKIINNIFGLLKSGGIFILEVRNPLHSKYMRAMDRSHIDSSWRKEGDSYILQKNEYCYKTNTNIMESVYIDTKNDTVRTIQSTCNNMNLQIIRELLSAAGFNNILYYSFNNEIIDELDTSILRCWLKCEKITAKTEN